jgi:hypothetical protein
LAKWLRSDILSPPVGFGFIKRERRERESGVEEIRDEGWKEERKVETNLVKYKSTRRV